MADITLANPGFDGHQIGIVKGQGMLTADVDLDAFDACYIDGTEVKKAVSTAKVDQVLASSGAETVTLSITKFDGVTDKAYKAGERVNLLSVGSLIKVVDSGLTTNAKFWVSGNAGKISDAVVATNDMPIAIAESATEIRIRR